MMDLFCPMISVLASLNAQPPTVLLASMLIMNTVKSVIKVSSPMIHGFVIPVKLPIVKLALKDSVYNVKLVISSFLMDLHVFLIFVKQI